VYFTEVQASMYTPGSNGFRGISTVPMKVYRCVCGELQLPPGFNSAVPAGSERALFAESLQAAADYSKQRSLDLMAQGMVSPAEHDNLLGVVNNLIEQFNAFVAGETVDVVAGLEPASGDEGEAEQPQQPQQTGGRDMSLPQPPDGAYANHDLPIAHGNRGRSNIASGSTQSNDGTRHVETAGRSVAPGGARGRMQRQGGGA
jgi:hypothetical protein